MLYSRVPRYFIGFLLFALVFFSARVRAEDRPSNSSYFAAGALGYGQAFSTEGAANNDSSSNGRALLWSVGLGFRARSWWALHGSAWGAWVPSAVVKYDQSDRERGVLRMQAVGLGTTFMAPWGGYATVAAGPAWERGTYLDRNKPFGCAFNLQLGYGIHASDRFQLGIGFQAGGFAGEFRTDALWTGGQGGIVLVATMP